METVANSSNFHMDHSDLLGDVWDSDLVSTLIQQQQQLSWF